MTSNAFQMQTRDGTDRSFFEITILWDNMGNAG